MGLNRRGRRLAVRWRLTLWYGGVLAAILAGFSASAYLMMRHHLVALTDAALLEEFHEFADELGRVDGPAELPEALGSRFARVKDHDFVLAAPDGAIVFRSRRAEAAGLDFRIQEFQIPNPDHLSNKKLASGADLAWGPGPSTRGATVAGLGAVRLARGWAQGPDGPLWLVAAGSLAPARRALGQLLFVFSTLGPIALACALAGGHLLARQALGPVDRIAAAAAEITAHHLDRRLAEAEADDELGALARTFNAMFERLERSFEEMRRFTADAAHELRTPLSAMRTEAEVALRSPRSAERDARVLEELLEEMGRLSRLVGQLLFLCREDMGIGEAEHREVRLDELIAEVGEHMNAVAREKGIELVLGPPAPCPVRGAPDRLRQLVFNLLDNAVKYTSPGGRVSIRGVERHGEIHLIVDDDGVGIPPEHLPHVFERFYRVDRSRTPEAEGSGLGLAICRSIAEAHGGRIEIQSTPGAGACVTLALPARRAVEAAGPPA